MYHLFYFYLSVCGQGKSVGEVLRTGSKFSLAMALALFHFSYSKLEMRLWVNIIRLSYERKDLEITRLIRGHSILSCDFSRGSQVHCKGICSTMSLLFLCDVYFECFSRTAVTFDSVDKSNKST